MHSENPLLAAEVLRVMPTYEDVARLFAADGSPGGNDEAPERRRSGIVRGELHMPEEYRC